MRKREFTGQAGRLLSLLQSRDELSTAEIQRKLDVGNVSDVAFRLNAHLALSGDNRRVVCDVKPDVNQHGERRRLGYWRVTHNPLAA